MPERRSNPRHLSGVLVCRHEIEEAAAMAATAVAGNVAPHQILIITTFLPPPGQEIEAILGPCWGITVRSRSVIGQACAGCQTFAGGEITALTKLAIDS